MSLIKNDPEKTSSVFCCSFFDLKPQSKFSSYDRIMHYGHQSFSPCQGLLTCCDFLDGHRLAWAFSVDLLYLAHCWTTLVVFLSLCARPDWDCTSSYCVLQQAFSLPTTAQPWCRCTAGSMVCCFYFHACLATNWPGTFLNLSSFASSWPHVNRISVTNERAQPVETILTLAGQFSDPIFPYEIFA